MSAIPPFLLVAALHSSLVHVLMQPHLHFTRNKMLSCLDAGGGRVQGSHLVYQSWTTCLWQVYDKYSRSILRVRRRSRRHLAYTMFLVGVWNIIWSRALQCILSMHRVAQFGWFITACLLPVAYHKFGHWWVPLSPFCSPCELARTCPSLVLLELCRLVSLDDTHFPLKPLPKRTHESTACTCTCTTHESGTTDQLYSYRGETSTYATSVRTIWSPVVRNPLLTVLYN